MNRIKRYRLAAGYTQEQLASMIHKSKGCVSLYEKGTRTPPVVVAKQIASAVGCGMDDLFMEDG